MTIIPFPTAKQRSHNAPLLSKNSIRKFQESLQEQLLEATKAIVEQEMLDIMEKLSMGTDELYACLSGGVMRVVIKFKDNVGYAEFSSTLPEAE